MKRDDYEINRVYILHTFGLGDAVMLLTALDRLRVTDRQKIVVITNQKVVFEYMHAKGQMAKLIKSREIFSLIFKVKSSGRRQAIIRSVGGTLMKNLVLSGICKTFGVEYHFNADHSDLKGYFSVRSSLNCNLLEIFFDLKEFDSQAASFPVERGFESTESTLPKNHQGHVLVHFGDGDDLNKALSQEAKKKIIDYYVKDPGVSTVSLLKGPRDADFPDIVDSKLRFLGGDQVVPLAELISMSKSIDLCACNDTGIGHLLSYESVPIDLWINGTSRAYIHQVLPNYVNSLKII